MLSRPFSHLLVRRAWSVGRLLRHPFVWLPAWAVVVLGGTVHSLAGPSERLPLPPSSATFQVVRQARVPKVKISKLPHLLAVGPMEIAIQPIAGPRVRRAPMLPPPTPAPRAEMPEPATDPDHEAQSEPKPAEPPQPSVFSPDAAPVLLPAEPAPADSPAEKKAVPTERALEAAPVREPELKEAVIFFDTPVGPPGAPASLPAIIPFTSPIGAPQPESRAEYREEKK